jgi:hypothetical protein
MARTLHLCAIAHCGEAACSAAPCRCRRELARDVKLERLRGDATRSAAVKAMQVAVMPIESKRQASHDGTAMGATEGGGDGAVEPRQLRHYRQHAWMQTSSIPPLGGRGLSTMGRELRSPARLETAQQPMTAWYVSPRGAGAAAVRSGGDAMLWSYVGAFGATATAAVPKAIRRD